MADTILVIEDKESMLDMLKQTLEAEGYRVIPAKDGSEGIRKLTDERIGLVLTDLKLPKKNGFEVLKENSTSRATRACQFPICILRIGRMNRVFREFRRLRAITSSSELMV